MKILNCIPACLLMFLLMSCSPGPEKVAIKFVEATNKGEYSEAEEYADDATGKMLSMINDFIPELKKKELAAQEVDVTVLSSVIKDSVATVKLDVKINNKTSGIKTIRLVKKGGDWKVTGGKEGQGSRSFPSVKPPVFMGKR